MGEDKEHSLVYQGALTWQVEGMGGLIHAGFRYGKGRALKKQQRMGPLFLFLLFFFSASLFYLVFFFLLPHIYGASIPHQTRHFHQLSTSWLQCMHYFAREGKKTTLWRFLVMETVVQQTALCTTGRPLLYPDYLKIKLCCDARWHDNNTVLLSDNGPYDYLSFI